MTAGCIHAQDLRPQESRQPWTLVPEIRRRLDAIHQRQPGKPKSPFTITARSSPPDSGCVIPLLEMIIPKSVDFQIRTFGPDPNALETMPPMKLPPVCPLFERP